MISEIIDTVYGPISNRYKESRLAELCVPNLGVQTGPFGSQLHARDYVEYGTPIITVEHLGENRIIHNNLPRITNKDKERLIKFILMTGDIVFSRVGSVDRRAIVRLNENGWLFSGRCLRIRPDQKKIFPSYLSWFFGLPGFKEHIRQIAVGATMPSLNTKILADIPIYYPPSLNEQQAIAEVLGSLDDKIELNQQMNKTLENIAQTIFKSWFVDFEPVKAKAEGRTIEGLSDEIMSLFPDSFEESELGLIPKGWKVGKIGDIAEVIGGGTPSTKVPEYFCNSGEGIAWLTPKDLSGYTFKFINKGNTDITEIGLKNSSARLIPAGTVLFTSRAPIGYIVIAKNEISTNQGFKSLIPKENMKTEYLYQYVKDNLQLIESRASGSTFKEVSGAVMKEIPILIPKARILNELEFIIQPINDKQENIRQEINTLSNILDSLLPKLISGEIRVGEAEKIVEGVL